MSKLSFFYEVVVFKHEGSLGRVTKEPGGGRRGILRGVKPS